MSEFRVRSEAGQGYVATRIVPLPHLLITATASGSAQTFYTVRNETLLKVKRLCVANLTGSAATLSLNSIPNGGSIGDSNAEVKAMSIAANTAVDLSRLVGGLYEGGAVLKAYSGTGSALVIHGWAEETR